MTDIFNVYCDESCHLENDHRPIMAIAAVWCPLVKTKQISREIRQIKCNHNLSRDFEIKWTKVSPAKIQFYLDLVDYFFSEDGLHFRGVIIEKQIIDHKKLNQTHDDWYYKMFFVLLKEIIDPNCGYRIYLDIKDTKSETKRKKLEEILKTTNYDAAGNIVDRVQQIRSNESEIMQLNDLLMGGLRYFNENLKTSSAKVQIIDKIKQLSGKSLNQTTWPKEPKFNILIWKPGGES